ncbi:MAG TPA: hypothetical protein VHW71_10735 [Steroidobacteraceae bacterium]|jgi:hypothetical protein|nr:hypothetical protein [Steroidobacteraceae bacterium]
MAHVTRRFFLLSSAALSVGCALREPGTAAPGLPARNVRQPVVGQSWRYAKHDIFTKGVVDDQWDRVASVDHSVEIDSSFEAAADTAKPKWGAKLLRKYTGHHETPAGTLPGEIQDPWGMVSVDPHWSQVQVYETPIPLWPAQLEPGWQTHIVTNYKTPADQDALPWDQLMKAQAWETVTVPAGQFKALRFTNYIKFKDGDFSRTNSIRRETLWFAPEVGRWVIRESQGTYYVADSTIVQPYNESGYRWELLEWS